MKIGNLRESFPLSRLYIFNMLVLSWVYLHNKILKENVVNLKILILGGNKEFVDWNVFPSESLKSSDTATTNSTYFFWLTWLVFKKIFMSSNEVDSPHQGCKLSVLFNINIVKTTCNFKWSSSCTYKEKGEINFNNLFNSVYYSAIILSCYWYEHC